MACMIVFATLLSVLVAASPGLGMHASYGGSGPRYVQDDDDSGGDSDDDDSGGDSDDDSGKPVDPEDDRPSGQPPSTERDDPPSSDRDRVPPGLDPDRPRGPDDPDSPSSDPSASGVPADDAPPPPPAVGESVNVAPLQGRVLVSSAPGSGFVPLGDAASLPTGSLVDARDGAITLTSASDRSGATQTAKFHGAVFQVLQDAGPRPVTELALRDTEGPISCEIRRSVRGVLRAIGSSRSSPLIHRALREGSPTFAARRRRGLWSNGRGRFRTRGRHGAASVRGTRWLTEDRCEGTFFRVTRGVVTVEDFSRGRTVTLGPGDSYLARLRR